MLNNGIIIMLLEDLFEDNELEFVNRDKILDFPEREYMKMSARKAILSTIYLWNRGIGKSRLISEMQKRMEKYAANERNLKILKPFIRNRGKRRFSECSCTASRSNSEVCRYLIMLFCYSGSKQRS